MAYQYIDGTGLWMNEAGEISLTNPQGNAAPQQQGPGYNIVTPVNGQWMSSHPGLRGSDLYAMFDDGRVERLYEASSGAHGEAPERILESELGKYQGQSFNNSADPFASSFVSPVSYAPATQKQSHDPWWQDVLPSLWMGAFGGAAASAAMGGGAGAAAGGTAAGEAGAAGAGAAGAAGGAAPYAGAATVEGLGAGGSAFGAAGAAGAGTTAGLAGGGGATGGGTTAAGAAEGTLGAGAGSSGGVVGAGEAAGGGILGGTTTGAGASTGLGGLLSNPQVLGSVGGALLGGLSGGGSAKTTQTEEGLPDWLLPYARPALDKYTAGLQNYNIDPYGVMSDAMKEFKNTVSGQYLDPSTNKYLEDYYKLGSERIKGSLSPTFGHMQAFGANSGYNEALSRGLGDFATQLYGGNYAKERDRQTAMTASAPQFLAQSSTAAFTPYQQYLQTLGNLGKKKEEPYFTNPWGGVLGGAMMGSQIGKMWG
jgi:hypothetical protein